MNLDNQLDKSLSVDSYEAKIQEIAVKSQAIVKQ